MPNEGRLQAPSFVCMGQRVSLTITQCPLHLGGEIWEITTILALALFNTFEYNQWRGF